MTTRQLNRHADLVAVCSGDQRYGREKTYDEPVLVRVLAGELRVVQGGRTYCYGTGETVLLSRHHPTTLLKYPKDGLAYQAMVLRLPMDLVRAYYTRPPAGPGRPAATGLLRLPDNPLLQSLFSSLRPYLELTHQLPDLLLAAKVTEAIEVLRSLCPQSDGILADFAEPGKLNLVEFMEKHYLVNLPLATFSTLTGRSLSTFKRDFRRAFQLSPQRWLTQKRLARAHDQLVTTGRKPVELYQEVGFENLAHFSFAFKKQFGYPPTALARPRAAPLLPTG